MPGDVYAYPYYPWMRQPIGHEEIWTSPNGYIYRPRYASPKEVPDDPMPAAPPAPTPASAHKPAVAPKPAPPPAESGPREF